MRKIIIALIVSIWASAALAGSCPNLLAKIDNQMAQASLSPEQLAEVLELRNKGEDAHNEGDHKASERALNAALEILDDASNS